MNGSQAVIVEVVGEAIILGFTGVWFVVEMVLLAQALLGGLVAVRLMQGRAVPVAGRRFPVRQMLSRVTLADLGQDALPLHSALIAGYRLTGVLLVGLVLVARA